jgi:hypothetical protein
MVSRRRGAARWRGEHEVLSLVAEVVELEAEGGAEPVEEVSAEAVPVACERRRRQVQRVRQRLHGREHLREPQRRVAPVHHHVLDRDDVLRRRLGVTPASPRRAAAAAAVAAEAHPSRLAKLQKGKKEQAEANPQMQHLDGGGGRGGGRGARLRGVGTTDAVGGDGGRDCAVKARTGEGAREGEPMRLSYFHTF